MISVIIPIYNCEDYLYVCLRSVLKQSYSDFEIICVDDGSTDSSLEILNYFAKLDTRVKIFKNSENKGLSYTRNRGIKHASGEYIFFLDGDDWISSNTFEELYNNAKFNDSDIVFYKLARLNENTFILDRPAFDLANYFDETTDFDNFCFTYKDIVPVVMNTSFSASLKLYKKSFLDMYDDFNFPQGLVYEDVIFHVKTILRASKISFVPKFLYVYKIDNDKSIIHDDSRIFDIFKIIDLVQDFLITNNYFNELKLEFYSFKILQILQYLNKTHNETYFKIAKMQFEELNLIFTLEIKHKIKENYINEWNDFLNVLNSDSVDEYLFKGNNDYILSKDIYKDLYHDDSKTIFEIWYLKNILSSEKDNILSFSEIEFAERKCDDVQLNNILEKFKSETINISDILCYQEKLSKDVLNSIDNEGNFNKHSNWALPSSIIGFKVYNSNKVILHEGHHRVAHLILNGVTEVNMKIFYAPEFLFKKWQNMSS